MVSSIRPPSSNVVTEVNERAMSRDEDVFPDPHSFKPERFFDEHGDLNSNNRILAYGFGRRICVGKSIASSLVS